VGRVYSAGALVRRDRFYILVALAGLSVTIGWLIFVMLAE
jgi:hypothetical protein